MRSILSSLILLVLSAPAFAVDPTVPEPGSVALLAVAGVAGLAVYLGKKRKK